MRRERQEDQAAAAADLPHAPRCEPARLGSWLGLRPPDRRKLSWVPHHQAVRRLSFASDRPSRLSAARRRPHALLVDESSYFAFMGATRPQFHLGVVGVWKGGITDPLAYLRSVGSDGAVLACRNLPPALRARAHRLGETCCLGPL